MTFLRLRVGVLAVTMAACAVALASCEDDETPVQPAPTSTGATIYGNGSAGAFTASVNATLDGSNLQFTSFTVETGVTLTIPSGAVIRCTGAFTNQGTIVVETGAFGSRQVASTSLVDGSYVPAEPGVSLRAASNGEYGNNTGNASAGSGGVGLSLFQAGMVLRPGPKAGGGSGGAYAQDGARGGGSIVVLAKGAISNEGAIAANGESLPARRGGGGGGVVVLASAASVNNTGTISAVGGNGGVSDSFAGVGGGGGGGIVHMIAPSVTPGTSDVSAGTAGTPGGAGSVTANPRQGGGGGGACGGAGGNGGSVSTTGNPNAGSNGAVGHVIVTETGPGSLFLAKSAWGDDTP